MSAVKERMADVIQDQPEDATYEEILRELVCEQMVLSGLEDARQEKTTSKGQATPVRRTAHGTWLALNSTKGTVRCYAESGNL